MLKQSDTPLMFVSCAFFGFNVATKLKKKQQNGDHFIAIGDLFYVLVNRFLVLVMLVQ